MGYIYILWKRSKANNQDIQKHATQSSFLNEKHNHVLVNAVKIIPFLQQL
jgi:hypothetical protein